MSGLYIPGMEMPKEHITLEICPNGEVWEQNWQGDGTLVGKAIFVPDHGRLVDADILPEFDGYALSADAIAEAVVTTPTVIPADKVEEGAG